MNHPLLQRQLNKFLGSTVVPDEALQHLLKAVAESYRNFEKDKALSEHAFYLNEQEFFEINHRLQKEVETRQRAEENLIQAIQSLDTKNETNLSGVLALDDIISFLQQQIVKRNETEQELINAKDFAEKAAMARAEFLSMMSHEIRTPLNAVVGTTYLLIQDNPSSHQEKYFEILKFSAENLMLLINDILDFNKIEAGKIQIEQVPFGIGKLITQVKNTNNKRAEENHTMIRIMVDSEIPNTVVGDPLRIGQILTNLVSNAVKFTKNGLVVIQVLQVEKTNTAVTLRFSVEDNGIGIDLIDQEKIFDKFVQASESTTREFGGTGLGLAISSKLLQLMNSAFVLKSELGKGSNFSFSLTLPYLEANNQEEELATITSEIYDLSPMRILLVEDNEFNSIIASKFLERWNATTDLAWNGEEAIEKALHNDYDLILMDLHMPIMNGYEATEKILAQKPNLPILALTASAMLDIKDKAFVCGMKDYITKPFNPNELYEKIKKYSNY
jgi:signal transduction histidine kinase